MNNYDNWHDIVDEDDTDMTQAEAREDAQAATEVQKREFEKELYAEEDDSKEKMHELKDKAEETYDEAKDKVHEWKEDLKDNV